MVSLGDEEWKKRLNDSGYKNWLKVSLALIESKEALHDFTENVIVVLHNDIKTRLGSGKCTTPSACNMRKGGGITGKSPPCPSCAQWVIEIKKQSNGQLQWKNADPTKWHNLPWEIAKCFMNAQEITLKHLKDKKLPKDVRKVRNDLMHCATMSFSDAEMQGMVDKVIALLEDYKELKHLKICQDKVKLIKSLRDNEFELKTKDEHVCIKTVLESHALAAESGDEVDKSMISKLRQFIKENKDLERKFDDKVNKIDEKLTNMKHKYDAEISRVDIDLGELKGRIEFLEKKLASGQSFPSDNPASKDMRSSHFTKVL
ncbi:Hypothetical predicted protein [Paramuricea clavata]|uniref:Uncharacterized protein n=1 Tax=Paramuricea clavata TaxID=317549 RepID=A0A6S7JQX9_PARCT|nr:Hypothetical predicted protein [Paramuricea clavata]